MWPTYSVFSWAYFSSVRRRAERPERNLSYDAIKGIYIATLIAVAMLIRYPPTTAGRVVHAALALMFMLTTAYYGK